MATIKTSILHFGGACVVYLAVAACSAATSGDGGHDEASAPSGARSGDVSPLDPVPRAEAAGEETATEPCDKSAGGWIYAEHAFPGRSAVELARVVPLASSPDAYFPGYSQMVVLSAAFGVPALVVRDGSVAVLCGMENSEDRGAKARATRVTFVLPR